MKILTNASSCVYLKMVWLDVEDYDYNSNLEKELILTCNNPESIDYHSENIWTKNCNDVDCPHYKSKE